MNKIDPELLKRLDDLGQKLGIAAGDAFRILIRQAYMEALSWLPFLVMWTVFAITAWRLVAYSRRRLEEDGDWLAGIAVGYVTMLAFSIGIVACISAVIPLLANPEGYALQKILERLR